MPSVFITLTACVSPMKRVGAKGVGIDAFEPISWDEALDTIAERFQAIAHEDGSGSDLALFLCRYHGLVSAIRGTPLALRDGLLPSERDDLCWDF